MMYKMFIQILIWEVNNAHVGKDKQENIIEFLESLEDDEDVQNVFSNANFGNN